MANGSRRDSFWVRLLSSAQQAQADARSATPERIRAERAGFELEHQRAAQDEEHGGGGVAAQVLAKERESQEDRERRFEVQQQRAGERRDAAEPEEHEHGTRYASGQHDERELWQVAATELRFLGGRRDQAMEPQTDRGPQIEESGEQHGRDGAEQDLRERRGGPEESGGAETEERAARLLTERTRAVVHHASWGDEGTTGS